MDAKIVMLSSAVFFGLMGIGLSFLPAELYGYVSKEVDQISILMLQILGASYLGFAMLNWMTRNNLIGGIYGKPLIIGNFVHFLGSVFALIKILGKIEHHFEIILVLTIIYAAFTLGFGFLFITNPGKFKSGE